MHIPTVTVSPRTTPAGKTVYQFWMPDPAGGSAKRKSTGLANRRKAQAAADAMVREAFETYRKAGASCTLKTALRMYLEEKRRSSRPREFETIVNKVLGLKPGIAGLDGAKYLTELTTDDLRRWRSARLEQGAAPGTVNKEINAIQAGIGLAAHTYEVNPRLTFRKLRVPETSHVRTIRPEEIDAALRELHPETPVRTARGKRKAIADMKVPDERKAEWLAQRQDNYDIFVMLLETGARAGEVLSLTWGQVDLDGEAPAVQLRRTKVNNEGWAVLSPKGVEVLRRRREELGGKFSCVFPGWEFRSGSKRAYKRRVDRPRVNLRTINHALRLAGLNDAEKLASHGRRSARHTRHTVITEVCAATGDPRLAQALAGHASLTTTQRYMKAVDRRDMAKTAAALHAFRQAR